MEYMQNNDVCIDSLQVKICDDKKDTHSHDLQNYAQLFLFV